MTFSSGLKKGLPIALGYFPVAFSFGALALSSGLPIGLASLISLTNLTSSGQFAGLTLILHNSSYLELMMTMIFINSRYFLMSLSLSQKLKPTMTTWQRMIFSFGVTDEVFAVASLEEEKLSFEYCLGLITLPIVGWSLGTLCAELFMGLLPLSLQNAMGIALYGMFIAIIVPPSCQHKEILEVVIVSATVSIALFYIPIFQSLGSGILLIISSCIGALYGAIRYPREGGIE